MAKVYGVSNEQMEQEYVHILSGLSVAGSLKVALSALGKRETSQVLAFNELFSIGPISGLDTLTGMQNRHQWMAERDENYSITDREDYLYIVKSYGQGVPLESDQRRAYEADWLRLAEENQMLRLWNDTAIVSCDESALDEVILSSVIELEQEQEQARNQASKGFVSAGSIFIRVLEVSRQLVDTSFFVNRMREMIKRGVLVSIGQPGALHQFSLRRAEVE
ncbi:DUF3658 domain-containing protein [Paenibacillus piscarius]|uniref:DUF3658 domain-containing protein n=1 Tax=Paenibacillus piscarius TaxID=1089681 RepID=UPI001EE86924|nr:DUF3658 domain-containing protein [Paenibacillus piscarius]